MRSGSVRGRKFIPSPKVKGCVLGICILYDMSVKVMDFVPLIRYFSLKFCSLDIRGRFCQPLLLLKSVIFCNSTADRWTGNNWRFWSNPFLIVPNAAIITGTMFVLTRHILLTLFSRSFYLLSFSVSFVLTFVSPGMAISISRWVFSLFIMQHCIRLVCQYCSICNNWYVPHNSVPLTFMSLSGKCS